MHVLLGLLLLSLSVLLFRLGLPYWRTPGESVQPENALGYVIAGGGLTLGTIVAFIAGICFIFN